jgi:hypothetical protein
MSKMPPIPAEQRSFSGDKARDRLRSAEPDRRDGDREVNARTQGQSANIRQNTHYQQDR